MLCSYIKYDQKGHIKAKSVRMQGSWRGEGESTRLFLLLMFSGNRINKGFALNVGETFHRSLRSSVSFLKSQKPLAKYHVSP